MVLISAMEFGVAKHEKRLRYNSSMRKSFGSDRVGYGMTRDRKNTRILRDHPTESRLGRK